MLLMANLGVTDHLDFCALLAIGVAGSLFGFLKYNYPPARIYMGDGGAYFLGFLIGILSIVNSNKGTVAAALIAPAFALALPIVDVSLAILRRGARGLPVFRPTKSTSIIISSSRSASRASVRCSISTLYRFSACSSRFAFSACRAPVAVLHRAAFWCCSWPAISPGFTRNWFEVGSQLGQSLRLRKETRYALTLDRWFMLEADRRGRLEDLWEDYQFVVRKLGFSRLKLTMPGHATRGWEADGFNPQNGSLLHAAHEISDGTVVELSADRRVMPEVLFTLLGDLAAETWYKAAQRCRTLEKTRPAAADEPPDKGASAHSVPDLAGTPAADTLIRQGICT